ncbi:uncharacterized protein LOC112571363 [Pomacea canaliculata]|uniref:uncharacterized protein LOC112571363 n=1 Tax=Pomacea canaliculata TaxID=400727 RepID=UPI000D72B3FA|nr:uncharacterized protein LOC112571363 [Pomacea canaliculata]
MGCQVSSSLQGYSIYSQGSTECRCQCHKNVMSELNDPDGNLKDDERIQLTRRQKFLIKRSWKAIGRNISQTGINMFMSLFEKNADAIKFFKQFDSATTLTDLRNNKLLESHVRGVMFTIDEAITTLDDADSVINMLLKVGKVTFALMDLIPTSFCFWKNPSSWLLATLLEIGIQCILRISTKKQSTLFSTCLLKASNRIISQITTLCPNP